MIRSPRKKAFNTGVSQISHRLLIPAKYHDCHLLSKERLRGEEKKKNRARVMSSILVLEFFFGGLVVIGGGSVGWEEHTCFATTTIDLQK